MNTKSKKIKKANMIHSIAFKTLQFDRALRYSLSLFISGLIFLFVSFNIISEPIKSTLQIFACLSITFCIYLLPFFDTDKIDKFVSKFIRYMALSILFIIYTVFWLAFCNIDTANENIVVIIMPMSLLEIIIMVIAINNTLKPIMYIISQISTILKKRAEENKERTFITYLKTLCANLSVIISFILTLITFVVTICNHVDPLEWINKIMT